jgi:hypothetical protein
MKGQVFWDLLIFRFSLELRVLFFQHSVLIHQRFHDGLKLDELFVQSTKTLPFPLFFAL